MFRNVIGGLAGLAVLVIGGGASDTHSYRLYLLGRAGDVGSYLISPISNTLTGKTLNSATSAAVESRSFYVFDLPNITDLIDSALLQLEFDRFIGAGPEAFEIFDVNQATLVPGVPEPNREPAVDVLAA